MNLTKNQTFDYIDKITKKLLLRPQDEIGLFLKVYTKSNERLNMQLYHELGFDGNEPIFRLIHFTYETISNLIQQFSDENIVKMYRNLFEDDDKNFLSDLSTDKLVLFFSHSHKEKGLVISVKNVLQKTDWIECFVAHEDIKIGKKWEQEIKEKLRNCDCLIAFLSKNFKSSPYCDQELGFAVCRNIPILSCVLDKTNVYGFIKHLQIKSFKDHEDLANKIEEFIFDKKENLYLKAEKKNSGSYEKNNKGLSLFFKCTSG